MLLAFALPVGVAAAIGIALSVVPESRLLRRSGVTACHGRDVTGEHWNAGFSLVDSDGGSVTLAAQKGKAVLVAFGYTHCPDACPTTLARLAQVRKLLGPDAERLRVFFVTVDPERDSAAMLGRYVRAFDPSFVGLRGDEKATDAAARSFHADYQILDYQGEVLVEHTVQTYLVDPAGRMRVVFPSFVAPADIAADVRSTLNETGICWPWST